MWREAEAPCRTKFMSGDGGGGGILLCMRISELSLAVGLSEAKLRSYERRGVISSSGGDYIVLDVVRALRAVGEDVRDVELGGDDLSIDDIERRIKLSRMRQEETRQAMLEMDRRERSLSLVGVVAVEEAFADLGAGITHRLNVLPDKLAARLLRLKTPAAVTKLLREELNLAIADIKKIDLLAIAEKRLEQTASQRHRARRRRTEN